MIRSLLIILTLALLPQFAGAQLPFVSPQVFSGLAVQQSSAQVTFTGTIGQVQIGAIASPTTMVNFQQGFWPQVRQVNWIPSGTGDEPLPELPAEFGLQQNYPNPFNPTTTIPFSLGGESQAKLVIYNTLGQEIRRFDLGAYGPGNYELSWNGTTHSGLPVPSGLYFYRLSTAEQSAVQRMLLLK
jgi:hypothetical protein